MKIAFLIANLNKGGAERAVSNISLELQDEHEIFVILFDAREIGYPHGGEIIALHSHPRKSMFGKVYNILERVYKLRRVYKKYKFDAVFAFMEGSGIPSVLANKNTIVSVRDNPKSLATIYKPIFPYLYPKSKKVVACSKAIEQELINDYGFNNTTTIYNIVDIERVVKLSKNSIIETRPFILSLGRLVPQKGYDLLIEAYANSKIKDNLDLLICGEGKDRDDLQALINKKGLTDKIILKGNVDNPFSYYTNAEFYILSSRHEGFPNILIEALACGCPCIAFDCKTGPNEIIKQGENGLLVEAENVHALTEAIDKLFADKELQNKFRKNAQSSVEHLSPEAIAQEWLKLI